MRRLILLVLLFSLAACAPAPVTTISTPTLTPTPAGIAPPEFTPQLLTSAVKELNLQTDQVTVISVEEVMWSDSCLGVHIKNLMCADVITPGYRIILETPDGKYELHTNKDGTNYRLIQYDATSPK
jgi:hypothetical protein